MAEDQVQVTGMTDEVHPGGDATDDGPPISAAESLRLIKEQQEATERSLTPDPRLIYWPWGLAWLIGFGLLYLRHGPGDQVLWNLPGWLPLASLFVLMLTAGLVSGIAGARAGSAVSGESNIKGMMYGFAWFLGFAGMAVTLARIEDFLPEPQVGLIWAATSVGLVSVLYLAGGAIWKSWDLFILGCWLAVINVGGVLAGPGWHSLVISLAGGGGLIVAGAIASLHMGRRW